MELKEESVDLKIKLQVSASSLLTTDRKWVEVDNKESAKSIIDETVRHHEETMTELAKGGRERWKEFLKKKVVDDAWGETRTMDLIEEYFILEEQEEEFIQKWIEIFRRVRIDDMEVDKAKGHVEHEQDPAQKNLGELA